MNNSNTFHYDCPGRKTSSNSEPTQKIQFPEQPKIYPLDITEEVEYRNCSIRQN